MIPSSCLDYLNPSKYSELASFQRFDGLAGAAVLIGGDECQFWLQKTVTMAYHAIKSYGIINPGIYGQLGVSAE